MSVLVWDYLSIKRDELDSPVFDEQSKQCIETIQKEYEKIDKSSNDEGECIKKLIDQFKLIEDDFCVACLKECISQKTVEDAIIELKQKVRDFNVLDKIPPVEKVQSSSNSVQETSKPVKEQHATSLDQIICIIHQKSTKSEGNDFLKEFLFQK
jgi:hypothetical protein